MAASDAALRELAARSRGVYTPGGSYEHKTIGTIRYCGSVRGEGWFARLDEDDDNGGTSFEIVIPDVALSSRDLRPRRILEPARPILQRLLDVTIRVDIVLHAWSLLDPASRRDGMTRCLRAVVRGVPAPRELEAIALDLTRLADALQPGAREPREPRTS